MKVKTSELTGAALDWAVAKCEGRTIRHDPMKIDSKGYWIWEEVPSGKGGILIHKSVYMRIGTEYSPSTNWAQGGPIKECEKIGTQWDQGRCEAAYEQFSTPVWDNQSYGIGQTELIAVMRCRVTNKLGDEVDVPRGLI